MGTVSRRSSSGDCSSSSNSASNHTNDIARSLALQRVDYVIAQANRNNTWGYHLVMAMLRSSSF